jgi:hypothetical protein
MMKIIIIIIIIIIITLLFEIISAIRKLSMSPFVCGYRGSTTRWGGGEFTRQRG